MGKIVIKNSKFLSSPARTGAPLLKTGQTTSYATGDDGDLQAGRAVNFFTLPKNNPFGNKNRFTALNGSQTYTNDIVIDWSTYDGETVLGYFRGDLTTNRIWVDAISNANTINLSGFIGWRLTNIRELLNLCNYSLSQVLNYAPINGVINTLSTSTSYATNTDQHYAMSGSTGAVSAQPKSTAYRHFICRTFTVNGTTLT
jgi:hypothetical protein